MVTLQDSISTTNLLYIAVNIAAIPKYNKDVKKKKKKKKVIFVYGISVLFTLLVFININFPLP